jgi:hypothetical protein
METTDLMMFKQTIKYENEYIWLKPVCDFFSISYENQTRNIKKDQILANQSTKKSNSLIFGDNYPRILLSKKGFIRWIQLVNSNTVDANLRERFCHFQDLVFDYLYESSNYNEHYELMLQGLAERIVDLRSRRDELQRQLSGLRKDIEVNTREMISLITTDRSQLTLPFTNE